jgi:hypothetical protein
MEKDGFVYLEYERPSAMSAARVGATIALTARRPCDGSNNSCQMARKIMAGSDCHTIEVPAWPPRSEGIRYIAGNINTMMNQKTHLPVVL